MENENDKRAFFWDCVTRMNWGLLFFSLILGKTLGGGWGLAFATIEFHTKMLSRKLVSALGNFKYISSVILRSWDGSVGRWGGWGVSECEGGVLGEGGPEELVS